MSEENNVTLDAKELELVEEETEKYIQDQVPWERVKRLVTKTEAHNLRYPERVFLDTTCFLAATLTGSMAFGIGSTDARRNYIVANHGTTYNTAYDAQRKAMDAYMYGGAKKFIRYFITAYAYTASFTWLAAGIDLYTMSTYQTNYGIAGAIVGGFSRFILGPRAVVAASILGFSLGTTAGVVVCPVLTWFDVNVEKRIYNEVRHNIIQSRLIQRHSEQVAAQLSSSYQLTSTQDHKKQLTLNTTPSISEAVQKAGITAGVTAKEK